MSPTQPRRNSVRFRERAELLDFLLNVADVTSETLDLDRLLASVADIVKEVIPSDLFAILLYSEKEHGLKIRYSIGHRDEIVRSLVIPLGEGITGAAAATRSPILVEDVRTRCALHQRARCRAIRTRGADDRAWQTGGRDRRAVHAGSRLHRA